MNLRWKIIAFLIGTLSVLSYGSVAFLQRQLMSEALIREGVEAEKDMRRLLLALDHQVDGLRVVLGSWANFTGLYQHAVKPDAEFRREELSDVSMRAAHFDWISLMDPRGRIFEHAEVPRADGSKPVLPLFTGERSSDVQEFSAMVLASGSGCGIVAVSTTLAFVCYAPLLTSDAQGPSRGTVLIGRYVTEATLDVVRRETELRFDLPQPTAPLPQTGAKPAYASAIARGDLARVALPETLELRLPVVGLAGRHIADVQLHWARSSLARMQAAQNNIVLTVLSMIAVTGIAVVLIVDRLVVRRLQRLQEELGRILENEKWDGTITTTGSDEISRLAGFARSMMDVIRDKVGALRTETQTDAMTGLANRRLFEERLQLALKLRHRHHRDGALLLFDVDYFKRYNDCYGHPAGDAVLVQVAQCLKGLASRPGDLAARLGGEEFALLLEDTSADGARNRADQVREALLDLAIAHTGSPDHGIVTLSCGVAMLSDQDSRDSVYARADAALYLAKEAGRNQVAEAAAPSG
jgi:diguanylate cyclase (GGDEF)-like protein